MTNHKPFAQPVDESIELQSPIERAKGGSTGVGTLPSCSDRVTFRAHPLSERTAPLLQRTGLVLLGQAGGYAE